MLVTLVLIRLALTTMTLVLMAGWLLGGEPVVAVTDLDHEGGTAIAHIVKNCKALTYLSVIGKELFCF